MAGGAFAQHDVVLAQRGQLEVAVEGGHAHDLSRAVAGALGHVVDHFLGQETIDGLGLLQDHDQAGGIVLILAEYAFHQRKINT